MKRLPALAASAAILLSAAMPAFAQAPASSTPGVSGWTQTGNGEANIMLSTTDDTYMAGELADTVAVVQGDVVATAGQVNIDDNIEGDLMAAGGNVTVSADVGDDVRVAGGFVTISGTVGDDLIIAGGTVHVLKSAVIQGEVVAFGGTVTISGTVHGGVQSKGGKITVDGTVDGDVSLQGEDIVVNGTVGGDAKLVGEDLRIGQNAVFNGTVEYWTKSGEADFGQSVATGAAVYNPDLRKHADRIDGAEAAGMFGIVAILWSAFSVLSAALLIFLFMLVPANVFGLAAKRLRTSPWLSLLLGFLFVVLTPVLLVAVAVTLIGIPLAMFGAALYAFTLYVSGVLAAMVGARWLEQRRAKRWSVLKVYFVSLGLFVVLQLLWFVPVLGWIVRCVVKVFAIGAVLMAKGDLWASLRK
jgi:cytoskeletal protein CcmA (bactofilin family)